MTHETPHDDAAEQATLGCALASKTVLREIADIITPADFYSPIHEQIFAAALRLDSQGRSVDPLTVAALMESEKIKGFDRLYLAELVGGVNVASNGAHYAGIVADKATRRRLVEVATAIAQQATSGRDTADTTEDARARLDQLTAGYRSDTSTFADVLPTVIDSIERGASAGDPTGWPDLDHLINGWQPGHLYVIAARPGVGKSILGLQAASYMWEAHGKATFFASLEMTRHELVTRQIASHARVPLSALIAGGDRVREDDWARVGLAHSKLQTSKIEISDEGRQTLGTIRSGARRLAHQQPLGMVVIDYLQLLTPRDHRLPREQQVAEMSRNAKLLAKELAVPVLLLSQLNRASEARPDRRPALSDLRESGAIEQDANVVLLMYQPDRENDADNIDLLVAKNRSGPQGDIELFRQGHYARLMPRYTR